MGNSKDDALKVWQDKIAFLERELAITADAAQKFSLRKQIEEAHLEIQRLTNNEQSPNKKESSFTTNVTGGQVGSIINIAHASSINIGSNRTETDKPGNMIMDRSELIRTLNSLIPAQFNELLMNIQPPKGIISPATAPQANRVYELIEWAESPTGKGLAHIKLTLDVILNPR